MLVLGVDDRADPAGAAPRVDARAPSGARAWSRAGTRSRSTSTIPHVHDLHIALMERLLNDPIDAVFTGEGYGDLLAERWGVEHVCRPARRG